jgi:hypothetical protein
MYELPSTPRACLRRATALFRLFSKSTCTPAGHKRSHSSARVHSVPGDVDSYASSRAGVCWSRTLTPWRSSSPLAALKRNGPNRILLGFW